MGIANTLNISELLRRLGVKGDSLGSAPLLESLRLTLNIGDLSDLVPPVGVARAGAAIASTSGVGTMNKWSLTPRSGGGLRVTRVETQAGDFDIWVRAVNPFGAVVVSASDDFGFGQVAQSAFRSHTPAAKVNPANVFSFGGAFPSILVREFENWIGPGEHLLIEERGSNTNREMRILWTEYPAGLNP